MNDDKMSGAGACWVDGWVAVIVVVRYSVLGYKKGSSSSSIYLTRVIDCKMNCLYRYCKNGDVRQ